MCSKLLLGKKNEEEVPSIAPTEKEKEETLPAAAVTTKQEADVEFLSEDQPGTSLETGMKRATRSASKQPPIKKSRKQEKPSKVTGPFILSQATLPCIPRKPTGMRTSILGYRMNSYRIVKAVPSLGLPYISAIMLELCESAVTTPVSVMLYARVVVKHLHIFASFTSGTAWNAMSVVTAGGLLLNGKST